MKSCWVISDGRTGHWAQATGLAAAVGLTPMVKTIQSNLPWRCLPAGLWPPGVLGSQVNEQVLAPPWPDLLISCGQQGAGPAAEIRRRAAGRCFAVHIHHPHAPLSRFDLIAAPAHDGLSGPNVMVTRGSLGRVNRASLNAALSQWPARASLLTLPYPRITVLLGGTSAAFTMDRTVAKTLARQIAEVTEKEGGSLLVTPSRRTGHENTIVFQKQFSALPGAVWDGTGENPYLPWLAAADVVLVTKDSVNMVSEACATGKPVLTLSLPVRSRRAARKFHRFHQDMEGHGHTRPFTGRLEQWAAPPLDETNRVAAEIKRELF